MKHKETLISLIHSHLQGVLGIYAFGSRIAGTNSESSDLDLAVLVAGYVEPLTLFDLAGVLADVTGYPVDLIDLRAASTVMQYQIVTTGERWWQKDVQAAIYEAAILSEKTELDTARRGFMSDILLISKAARIECCVARAREEYEISPDTFAQNHTRQDAAILNIQRACEAALDMGHHLIRREKLGVPQSARDVFTLLAQSGWIEQGLADVLKHMVGFRNIAVHDYQALQLPITVTILEKHLDDFLQYTKTLLLNDASRSNKP